MKIIWEVGDTVLHKSSYQSMIIVAINGKSVKCRCYNEQTGKYSVEEFFSFELTT